MLSSTPCSLVTAVAALLASSTALARQESAAVAPAESPFRVSVGGGYVHQFSADLDNSGSVSVDRGFGTVSSAYDISPAMTIGLRLAWEGGWYNFDDASPLSLGTGQHPWHSTHAIQLGGRLGWKLDDRWSLSLGAFGSAAGETDADAEDSLTFGGSVGVMYRATDRFTIGGGVLASSQLEDDALIVPLLLIDWRITDSIRLSNVAGPEAYPTGAGLELSCTAFEQWEFGVGGKWESRRFRLDDEGPAPNGVGEDEGLAFWFRAGVRPMDNLRVDALVGFMAGEEFTLDDVDGNELASVDVDPAPFVGLFVSYRF